MIRLVEIDVALGTAPLLFKVPESLTEGVLLTELEKRGVPRSRVRWLGEQESRRWYWAQLQEMARLEDVPSEAGGFGFTRSHN